MTKNTIIALLAASISLHVDASPFPRSAAAKHEFQRLHHCPPTDKPRGPCHGYVIDHIVPLCAGGADRPENMQWQIIEEAKAKDIEERRLCAKLRNAAP